MADMFNVKGDIEITGADKAKLTLTELVNMGANLGESLGAKFSAVGDKMTAMGKKVAPVSAAVTGFGVAATAAFKNVDKGGDAVIMATGAVGEKAKELRGIYKDVATSVAGSFEEVGNTVGAVATRFGDTGQSVKDLSVEFQKFSTISGVGGQQAVESVDRALSLFNLDASEATNVMDLITVTAQNTGISFEKLLGAIDQSGSTFKQLGFSVDESITLMGQFESAGLNSSQMLMGLKKGAASFAKDGKNVREGLTDLINRLKDTGTQAQAESEAWDIFGARMGGAFISAAKEGKISLDDLKANLAEYGGAVDDTYAETRDGVDKMKGAWKKLQVALEGIGNAIGNTLGPVMEKGSRAIMNIGQAFEKIPAPIQHAIVIFGTLLAAAAPVLLIGGKIASGLGTAFTAFSKFSGAIGNAIGGIGRLGSAFSLLSGPVGIVIAVIGALIAAFAYLYNTNEEFRNQMNALGGQLLQVFQNLWAQLQPVFEQLAGVFMNLIQTIAPLITGLLQSLAPVFAQIITIAVNLITQIMTAIQPLLDLLTGTVLPIIMNVINALMPAISSIISMLVPAIQLVMNIISALMSVLTPIINVLVSVLTPIIQLLTSIIGGILTALQPVIDFIANYVVVYIQTVVGIITGIIQLLTGDFSGAAATFQGVLQGLADFFMGIWNGIASFFSGIWNGITSFLSGALSGMVSAIGSFIGNAVSFFSSLPGRILGALANIGSLLFNVGRDLVQGFINGVQSFIGNLISAVTGIFGGVVDAVKGLLGIHSPSKVFGEMGEESDEGYALGVIENADAPIQAVKRVMSAVVDVPQQIDINRNLNVAQSYQPNANIFSLLAAWLPMLMNMRVVLEDGTIVGKLAPAMNEELGRITRNGYRGR